ncbi:histidine kinase [Rubrobacter tropicus]|uniref:Oxygen sensor histidine kinase NreB n=1 Tax=Rubrobacter tropicus TaxID=2653851 RepID=A0A6G8Q7Q0_9ACTN|nr:histidine kinase [Rubrobacter tropicus]QIN82347.1 histidine kinase [Rubrobacter tropicus]
MTRRTILVVLAGVVLIGAAVFLIGGTKPNTVKGGNGDDNLSGGPGTDRLLGLAGDDELYGGEGPDGLFGNRGADDLRLGASGGSAQGGPDEDELAGGRGRDRLDGATEVDRLEGGPGADRLEGGRGNDELAGGEGGDSIFGEGDATTSPAGRGRFPLRGGRRPRRDRRLRPRGQRHSLGRPGRRYVRVRDPVTVAREKATVSVARDWPLTAAWFLWSLCAVMIFSSLALDALTPNLLAPPERPGLGLAVFTALLSLACPTIGVLVVSRLPRNLVGWIFCGVGLIYGARRLAAAYTDHALLVRPSLPGGDLSAWASTILGLPLLVAFGVFLTLLFPEGRPPSRSWKWAAWGAVCGTALICLSEALRFGPLPAYYFVSNPLGLADAPGGLPVRRLLDASYLAGGALLSLASAASIVLLLVRLRRAGGDGRQQLGWFACAAIPALAGGMLLLLDRAVEKLSLLFFGQAVRPLLQVAGSFGVFVRQDRTLGPLAELRLETTLELLIVVALFFVPVFTGVAVLRHRLYDVDAVINRALVYGSLTAVVAALYVLLVAVFGALFRVGAGGNLVVSLVATGLVAVLFQPLRARLQDGVDRLMYGQRRDPYAALSRLGERLEAAFVPEAVLPTIVETVARAMGIPHAEISLKKDGGFETASVYGSPAGVPTILTLRHGKDQIGRLILSPPSPDEPFSEADHRLLRDLARQAEVAVYAVRLTADLRRSRERLVTTREEERRRLRRDLHDGLGPSLAGLSFGLEAARRLVDERPEDATKLLAQLEEQTQETVVNIRRLVYGLRPPALDDLGLVPAIRQQAEAFGSLTEEAALGENVVAFSVATPEELPPLPAAVEVACYRIAQEALTNVVRHAGARSCRVRLSPRRDVLELEVTDDGVGLGENRGAGVGLASMRERAEELGGTCAIEDAPHGGTRVLARLPLEVSGAGYQAPGRDGGAP